MSASSNTLVNAALADHAALVALGRSLVGPEGDDVVQDALLGAIRDDRPVLNPVAWMRRVIRNRAHSVRRAALRRQGREDAVSVRPEPVDIEADLARSRVLDALQAAWSALEEPYGEALRMRFEEGLSAREIGARQGCPANTASWRVREGVCRLRKRLDSEFGDRRHWFGALVVVTGLPTAATPTAQTDPTAMKTIPITLVVLLTTTGAAAAYTLSPDGDEASTATAARTSDPGHRRDATASSAAAAPVAAPAAQPSSVAAASGQRASAAAHAAEAHNRTYGVQIEMRGRGMTNDEGISELSANARDLYGSCADETGHGAEGRFEFRVDFATENGRSAETGFAPLEAGTGPQAMAACLHDSLFDERDREYTPGFDGTLTFSFWPISDQDSEPSVVAQNVLNSTPHEIDIKGSPSRGGATDAPLVVVECMDPACPYARRAAPTIDRVVDEYGDSLRYAVLQNPLPFHSGSRLKSLALVAADQQGKFWEATDFLYTHPAPMERAELVAMAATLELDVSRFDADLNAPATSDELDRQQALCTSNEGKGSPTFYVNGLRISGAVEFDVFKRVLDGVQAREG